MPTIIAIGLIGVAIAAVWVFWHSILRWSHRSLIPWIRSKNLPRLAEIAEDAFLQLDRGINFTGHLARKAWDAWKKFRLLLIKGTVTFKRIDNNQIVRQIDNWIAEPTDTSVISHQIQESEVDWSELPAEVRMSLLEKRHHIVDITKARDAEFAEMQLQN